MVITLLPLLTLGSTSVSNEEIRAAYERLKSQQAVANELGISRGKVQRALAATSLTETRKSTEDGELITLKTTTIRTLEDALEHTKVDLDVWEVKNYMINKWDQGTTENVKELWQVKIWLTKKEPDHVVRGIEMLSERVADWKPVTPTFTTSTEDPHLLEISLFDVHFGKLAWAPETGDDYNLKIAAKRYSAAIDDLLTKANGYNIDQVLLPIGSDFFHVNSWRNTTSNDTQLDVDTRMAKIFDVGCAAVINAVARCLEVAPVNVIWIPGNHDAESSYYMSKIVDTWYRNVDEVRVNCEPKERKYVGYGATLLGFTHGDQEPHNQLPILMATESNLFHTAKWKVWHVGHFHKKKETRYNAGDTYNGVRVQILPSLTGTDKWHYQKGFVKGNRSAECYMWNYRDGYSGHFST
jgi:hypothetical protein